MRTTLDIADDVLLAAKELARRQRQSVGQVISDLARRAFAQGAGQAEAGAAHGTAEQLAPYGIRPLPPRGGLVTNALIDRLRDEEGV